MRNGVSVKLSTEKVEATRYFNKILKLFSTFNTGATGLNNG